MMCLQYFVTISNKWIMDTFFKINSVMILFSFSEHRSFMPSYFSGKKAVFFLLLFYLLLFIYLYIYSSFLFAILHLSFVDCIRNLWWISIFYFQNVLNMRFMKTFLVIRRRWIYIYLSFNLFLNAISQHLWFFYYQIKRKKMRNILTFETDKGISISRTS